MSVILPHMVCFSANLRCRSETCCTRLAENTGRKKVAKNRHLGTIAQRCGAISLQLRHVSTIGKSLLSINTSSTCPHNMANFGPLTAEIGWSVWTQCSNGRQPNFAALNTGATYIRQGDHHVGHWPTFLVLSCFFLLFYSSPNLSVRWLDVHHFYTWCGPSANLECRSEMCCTRLAGNARPKKSPKIRHLGTIAQLCRAISSQLRHLSTIGKKLLSSNVSPTCPHNMVNFGPLAAEIPWRVWGILANFNGFRVSALE